MFNWQNIWVSSIAEPNPNPLKYESVRLATLSIDQVSNNWTQFIVDKGVQTTKASLSELEVGSGVSTAVEK